jgi:hypothetical protein
MRIALRWWWRAARVSASHQPERPGRGPEESASELLQWLAYVRFNDQDYLGTLLATLALRRHDASVETSASDMFMRVRGSTMLDAAMGTAPQGPSDYVFAPFDKILTELGERVSPAVAGHES